MKSRQTFQRNNEKSYHQKHTIKEESVEMSLLLNIRDIESKNKSDISLKCLFKKNGKIYFHFRIVKNKEQKTNKKPRKIKTEQKIKTIKIIASK